ncbi:unnamed protein product, partial [Tetraodon nigroviridis]
VPDCAQGGLYKPVPVPPLHWLLLVCAGRHRTTHTWDLHQVRTAQVRW